MKPETHPDYLAAQEFSRAVASSGWMCITGAANGIMKAGLESLTPESSFGLSIRLPFEAPTNTFIEGDPKLIHFRYFFTRKLTFVKEAHAFALFPGGFGTLDETFEVLTLMQTGKARIIPVVLLDRPRGSYWDRWMKFLTDRLLRPGFISPEDFSFFKIMRSIRDAVEEILHFYKVFHSMRWVKERLVIRLNQALSKRALTDLNDKFADLLRKGEIVQGTALREEKTESEVWNLPRLILTPHRDRFGRLRQLIDAINSSSAA